MRVNVNIDDDFLKEIDESAKKLHLSRSAFICLSCSVCMAMPFGMSTLNTKKNVWDTLIKGKPILLDDENEENE